MTAPEELEGDDAEVCGVSYDHRTTEETADGVTVWTCRECGAEGIEDASTGEPLR